jgi:hypothetical protein
MNCEEKGDAKRGALPCEARRIKKELITPELTARIKQATKANNQLRQKRQKRFGVRESLLDNLTRFRLDCGSFAAWVAILRIEQNQGRTLSPEDRIFLERQKEILREAGLSPLEKLLCEVFNL